MRDGRNTASLVLAALLAGVTGGATGVHADRAPVPLPERPGEARWPQTPLPQTLREGLARLPADPGLGRVPAHYVISDERRHDVYRPFVEGIGGVFVGVGTDQNYLMAGWVRPELLVVVDYDPLVVALHHVYQLVFRHAETPERFRELWEEGAAEQVAAWIAQEAPDERAARRWRRAWRASARLVRGKLRRTARDLKARGVPSFLDDRVQYEGLRRLVQQGRVVALHADFTGPRRLRALWRLLREAGATVRVFYVSNVERYFDYDTGRFRANLREAPADERSVLLRTVGWGHRWPSPEGDGRYLYVVQPLRNLQRWLEHPRVRTYKPMVRRRRPTPVQGLYFTADKPPPLRRPPRRPARRGRSQRTGSRSGGTGGSPGGGDGGAR